MEMSASSTSLRRADSRRPHCVRAWASATRRSSFFGTLSRYKGVDVLLDAFPAVHHATGAHLVIAGYPFHDFDVAGASGAGGADSA